ncbi:crotonase/enoyl-CoA hydratase family protein [Microbispora sp. RL4-1S]|uniref:Crotonase/enoyl-CoA hydratase family protein n=1 Tax=Microbispora oryzae TaxID=2806554 RepID=A0A941AJF4_9ACTN|nr:crotonase/enoyl-CoA hydratase family protein [Microbispora oryzae]MBP2704922.1 crotonase/enoyl-CoA hydratase family protein [Microbispora oryzae]
MTEDVLVEVDGAVGVVTINRPKSRNAVNGAVARGIAAAMDDLDGRRDVAVIVLTGAGGTFSAGMDLKGFLAGDLPVIEGRGFGGLVEAPPRKPLIAAVEGYALAGGFELVLSCDIVVASEEAKFGLPEPRRGLVAGAGGVMRVPRRIPYHVAMEIALTGDHYPASRLHELGLVNRVTPAGGALGGALELARVIAANAPLALAATKRIVVESADWRRDEMFGKQAEIVNPIFASKDAMEGAAAFAEKRAPNWKGE